MESSPCSCLFVASMFGLLGSRNYSLQQVVQMKLTSHADSLEDGNDLHTVPKWSQSDFTINVRGWSQKICTHWQHCISNDAIFPTISAVVLENFRQLVQCNLFSGVCALGNNRALKLWLFMSQVPRLMTISARTSKLKHYARKLQQRSAVRWWKCVVWKLLTEAKFHTGLNAFVREGWT